ncbi:unnamed protein product [Ectocarpus sp. CCAP 1310/34]|nr:unnamed protein product [Ectocarpus sp. CCAP 1310/34]
MHQNRQPSSMSGCNAPYISSATKHVLDRYLLPLYIQNLDYIAAHRRLTLTKPAQL